LCSHESRMNHQEHSPNFRAGMLSLEKQAWSG